MGDVFMGESIMRYFSSIIRQTPLFYFIELHKTFVFKWHPGTAKKTAREKLYRR